MPRFYLRRGLHEAPIDVEALQAIKTDFGLKNLPAGSVN
jgi:hypothetical protein